MTAQQQLATLGLRLLAGLTIAILLFAAGVVHGERGQRTVIDGLKAELTQARTDNKVLQARIDGYTETAQAVEDVRSLLVDRAAADKAQAQRVLNVLNRPLPRTGDECADAKAIARQYFNELQGGAR